MRPVPRVGRNESCPCGSGKKFKHCCAEAKARRGRVTTMVALALATAVALAAIMGVVSVWNSPGETQPRQVWSPEHGHYHTVP